MMDDIVHLPVSAGATSSSSVEADVIVPRPPIDVAIIVRSLLEEGRMKDAAHALLLDATTTSNDDDDDDLRAVASPPPPTASTYHEVIEAMCAGGGGGGGGGADRSKRDDDIGNIDDRDMMDLAEELLISMGGRVGVGITNHARAVVISGYARRGDWMGAMRILTDMEVDIDDDDGGRGRGEEGGYSSSSSGGELYRTVLTSLAKANRYDMVNDLLTNMRKRGKRPDVYVYNSLLKICATDPVPRWKEGLSLLSQCQREPGVMPDLITYTTAMRACARGRKAGKAMELYRAVRDMGTLTLDVYFYTTAMDACAKEGGRRWMAVALSLLDEMIGGGIVPNEVTYGVAVTACGNGGRWVEALELLDRMRDAGLRINTITYNSAIAALSRAARSESRQQHQQRAVASSSSGGDSSSVAAADADVLWEKASNLMKCMEDEGVRRDSFTYSSAICVCGAAGRWREAVDLITKMKGDGARPNRVAYTSAITACASSRYLLILICRLFISSLGYISHTLADRELMSFNFYSSWNQKTVGVGLRFIQRNEERRSTARYSCLQRVDRRGDELK
jgi:pentatricopeptide repeat protein